jgi:YHS domain-containing protein
MALLARVLRFFFWVVVISWGFRLLSRYFTRMLQSGQPPQNIDPRRDPANATSLVRDPVCGVYVSEVLAIPLLENGQALHFCSASCRDAYLQPSRKLAAH